MNEVTYYGVPRRLGEELEAIADRVDRAISPEELPRICVIMNCSHALSDRNFAAVEVGSPTRLYLCHDLTSQPVSRIRGILWHEMGHILCDIFGPPDEWPNTGLVGVAELDEEQQTDLAVELLCGVRIYYDEDLVQRAGPGARGTHPRPPLLR